jgi:transposase-like protein
MGAFLTKGEFDEEECRRFVVEMRWPHGVECPRCHSDSFIRLDRRGRRGREGIVYKCRDCKYQFTVTSGTSLHRTHLPLSTWLIAIAMKMKSKGQLSPMELSRQAGLTYKTAWLVSRRLQRDKDEKLIRAIARALKGRLERT